MGFLQYIVTMPTISVPIPHNLEPFINEMIARGAAPNKAEVVRQALVRYAEDQAVEDVMRSEQKVREGKFCEAIWMSLLNKYPDSALIEAEIFGIL